MGVPSEKVRELLDELGVEHCDASYKRDAHITSWASGDAVFCFTDESPHQTDLHIENCTPEQAIAATVGVDQNTKETVRDLLDKFSTELCNAGCVVECKTFEERRRLIDATKDKYARTIAATEGAGTCHLEECEHEREIPYDLPDCDGGWYTEVTYDCDECGYENTDPNIRFCGGCGRRVVSE